MSQQVYVNRGGTLPRRPPEVEAKDVGPGKVFSGPDWDVTAAPAEHVQPWLDSLAYRLEELASGADTLLCMCWDDQDVMDENGEHVGQCGTTGAARMARDAGVKRLVLVHMGPGLSPEEARLKAEKDVGSVFKEEVVFSEELMSIPV